MPAGCVLNGVGNGLAQYWWTRAIHLAPTSVVSPFQYFSLIWAMMLGFAIWGDVPTVSLIIGGAIVAGSGLFLLWRESKARMIPKKPAPDLIRGGNRFSDKIMRKCKGA